MSTILFLDTNFFLHLKDAAALPWADVSPDEELLLLVPRRVQTEIDSLKQDGNSRRSRRARKASSFLRRVIQSADGGGAQQFQPSRVSVSLPDCRLCLLPCKQSAPDPLKNSLAGLESGPLRSGSPQPIGARKEDNTHVLQESHHSHRISWPGRRKPLDTEWHRLHSLVACHQRELEEKGSNEYQTRTEWHRVISWNKLAEWASTLPKGAYIEIEGELRYREYTPAESDRSVRVAEIHANSILALDRSGRQPVSALESVPADEAVD